MDNLVSVIIPVYNVENYLSECVDSVIEQTYPNIEIILVDDGSNDSSGKLCDEYSMKNNNITVIHKSNGGVSDARNAGMEVAHGDYIYFLDSDDFISKDCISGLLSKALECNADVVFFETKSFYDCHYNDSDNVFDANYQFFSGDVGVLTGREYYKLLMQTNTYHACIPFQFFKRDFLNENGIKLIKGIVHEDHIFTLQSLFCAQRVVHINEAFHKRRVRNGSIMTTRKTFKNFYGFYVSFIELLKYYDNVCDNKDDEFIDLALSDFFNNLMHIYNSVDINDREKCKSLYKEVKKIAKKREFERLRKNVNSEWIYLLKSKLASIKIVNKIYHLIKNV